MAVPRRRADLERVAQEQVAQLRPQETHSRPTPDPQATHNGPTPIRKVRIPAEQWEALAQYAKRRGISTSAALRLAIAEFLR